MQHEHLAVAVDARADADRRDRKTPGRECADGRRDRLQHDREGAGVLEREGVIDELSGGPCGLGLHLESAELRHALRREADVGHDRDAVRAERAHRLDDLGAALDLHRVHPGFLEEARGVPERIGWSRLVAPERHVADEQRPRRAARDGGRVSDHVVHRHGNGRRVAEHDHAQRIAD